VGYIRRTQKNRTASAEESQKRRMNLGVGEITEDLEAQKQQLAYLRQVQASDASADARRPGLISTV
jgi:hypothetical protein